MKPILSVGCLFALFISACVSDPDAQRTERIKRSAVESSQAFRRGDYETMANQTYPKLVSLLGGRKETIAAMKAMMKEVQARGLVPTAMSVGAPSKPVRSNGKLFSVVPTSLTMAAPDVRITQRSFMLAISTDEGNAWTFLSGSQLTKEIRAQIIPDLPPDLKLPQEPAPIVQRTR